MCIFWANRSLICFCAFTAAVLLSACRSPDYIDCDDLERFHTTYVSSSEAAFTQQDETFRIYIDFSNGMHEAITAGLWFIEDLLTMVNYPTTTYLRVGAQDPYDVDIRTPPNVPRNLGSYSDNRSILDAPISMIIEDTRNTSVFITDFELVRSDERILEIIQDGRRFQSQIDVTPWATNDFAQWLHRGNQIDIFALEFSRRNLWVREMQTQHLYILVFTPRETLSQPNLLVQRLQDRLQVTTQTGVHQFAFNASRFSPFPNYVTQERGGQHDFLNAFEICSRPEQDFEFYHFSQRELVEIAFSQTDQDTRFLRRLFLPEDPLYSSPDFRLRAYDITDAYADYIAFMSQPEPVYDVNPETGERKLVSDPVEEYVFQHPRPSTERFDIVFNPHDREIGIKLHPNYTRLNGSTLFMVDVTMSARPTFDPEMRSVLSWRDARGFEVPSLYTSITEALERVSVNDHVVYTYYILTDPR